MLAEELLPALEKLALVTGLGLIVGLERERAGKDAGLRTFSLMAVAGFLASRLGVVFTAVTLGFVGVVVALLNLRALRLGQGAELTTSAALFVTTLAGVLVGQGLVFTPVAVVIITLMLLSWKDEMMAITHALSRDEVHAAITLGLLAFVILPALPISSVDPWGLLVPRKLWVMVVLISAMGFANYVLLRLYSARGIVWTGLLGGLVNSTATVVEMARKVAVQPELADYAFRGIMLAKMAMFLRNGLILGLFAPRALATGLLPVAMMLAVAFILAAWRGRQAEPQTPTAVALSSPFSLWAALKFGMVFLFLTVLAGTAQRLAGDGGFLAIAFFGGLVSSSSTAASAANLAAQGSISAAAAGEGGVLTSVASAVVLVPVVWQTARHRRLGMRMARATALILLAGAVGWILNPALLEMLQTLLLW